MTSTNVPSNVGPGSVAGLLAPLGRGGADVTLTAPGPGGLRCDAVTAPLELCCGVFGELARIGGPVPPMARRGDRMLFLVRAGSAASALASPSMSAHCESLGIEMTPAGSPPGTTDPVVTAGPGSWVVPPPAPGADLPPASTVLTAIRAAHAATRKREGTR
jgi:hypothetical protein